MNIAMENTREFALGKFTEEYGDCFIRGNNVLYICADNED
jgi:U6 snRNA-associated Sm-like protein LSm6